MLIDQHPIPTLTVLDELNKKVEQGHRVDSRIYRLLYEQNPVYATVIETQEEFLKLIFHEGCPSRLLTPAEQPRSLEDVVNRMENMNLTFETLTHDLSHDRYYHHPEWFSQCVQINSAFTYDYFSPIFLTDSTDLELFQTPGSPFHIYDGTHRSLVLAWKIIKEGFQYERIRAYLFRPRPVNA